MTEQKSPFRYNHPLPTKFPNTSSSFRGALKSLIHAIELEEESNINQTIPTSSSSSKRRKRRGRGSVSLITTTNNNKKQREYPYVSEERKSNNNNDDSKKTIHNPLCCVLTSNSDAICIYDRYPKARYHVLLIPRPSSMLGNVMTLNDVVPNRHLMALKEFHRFGWEIAKWIKNGSGGGGGEVMMMMMLGYHAIPSLEPLHLHILSNDLDSDFVKNKKHVNSFTNTKFFISTSDVERHLESAFVDGIQLRIRDDRAHDMMRSVPFLRCWKCGRRSKNFVEWKRHNGDCCEMGMVNDGDDGEFNGNSLLGWRREK